MTNELCQHKETFDNTTFLRCLRCDLVTRDGKTWKEPTEMEGGKTKFRFYNPVMRGSESGGGDV